ncbi:EF-hand domain-containing protein [Sphingomonas sp. SUN039]|uniref:EF-hand domain-containing protein n=1 Tax=Sphingomonas sp. SUN039 TaxID=2937787 RepID=UPI00216450F4|nr:EF-hand domain-containing protein [Sphingomonas sp. SUN039]UVO53223.1 EF-hand domain-containing protein [Sphingomonas sp. SUN039]
MGRFLAGVAAALLLVTGGFFIWRAQADRGTVIPALAATPAEAPMGLADLAGPPAASERTREEKRFARYDKDRNGAVAREEYLLARRKNFAKLDLNGDGRLGFEEYAVKAVAKFAAADKDKSGALGPAEFALTRVVRKSAPKCACKPAIRTPAAAPAAEDAPEEQ